MKKEIKTPKMIRQRRLLLVLPLITLPFLTMLFWALGGGSLESVRAQSNKEGFNMNFPDANLKEDKGLDKMSYYTKATMDSLKFQELIKNDPNYQQAKLLDTGFYQNNKSENDQQRINNSVYGNNGYNDNYSQKIEAKLAELNHQINNSANSDQSHNGVIQTGRYDEEGDSKEVKRLKAMMAGMDNQGSEDPEISQLNGMMEKILEIQHPERTNEKLKEISDKNRGRVFSVSGVANGDQISLLVGNKGGITNNGFYSIDEENRIEDTPNAIQAVINEDQVLVSGSTVKLRLTDTIFIDGILIPKDHFLFGSASLNGERLEVKIDNIRFNNSIFPVRLSVYDLDGMEGIYIPGAITRDVSKQSMDRSIQTLGVTSLDPSWGSQAAGAGIEAAKSLLAKKIKLVKVLVKGGYKVLLLDRKQTNNSSN